MDEHEFEVWRYAGMWPLCEKANEGDILCLKTFHSINSIKITVRIIGRKGQNESSPLAFPQNGCEIIGLTIGGWDG